MTAVYEPGIDVGEFEALARAADRETEGVRLELIGGRLGVKTVPDGNHDWIVNWLLVLVMSLGRNLFLHQGRGLEVGSYRNGRARPDGVLAPMDAFIGAGEWASTDPVLMAVEVTSRDHDTNQRDRIDKPAAYAQADIPIYLLVDRDCEEVVVHAEPDGTRYQVVHRYAFGHAVTLPEPVATTLDTTPLVERLR
jgi:Uma2 family endonuclease